MFPCWWINSVESKILWYRREMGELIQFFFFFLNMQCDGIRFSEEQNRYIQVRNWIFPALSVNKGCQSHQQLQSTWMVMVNWWTLRKLRMWKHRKLVPDSSGAYKRNNFSKLRLLHFLIHRKALNSLNWDIWFSLINNNLVGLSILCCKI